MAEKRAEAKCPDCGGRIREGRFGRTDHYDEEGECWFEEGSQASLVCAERQLAAKEAENERLRSRLVRIGVIYKVCDDARRAAQLHDASACDEGRDGLEDERQWFQTHDRLWRKLELSQRVLDGLLAAEAAKEKTDG